MDDAKLFQGVVTFKVYGDGELIWSSRPLPRRPARFQECSFRLSGIRTLKLEVTCAGIQ